MIIVWGSIETTAEALTEVLELSLEHVRRSRREPGCITHSVQVDAENPNRLVFYEEWQSMSHLKAHFSVPAAVRFIRSVSRKATVAPVMKLYEASPVDT